MKKNNYLGMFVLISMGIFLPHCDLMQKPAATTSDAKTETSSRALSSPAITKDAQGNIIAQPSGEVLMTMYGDKQPRVSVTDFQNYKKELLEAQPNYASIIEFMPGANEQIFESLVNEAILEEWALKNKLAQTQAYKDDLDKIMKYARRSLNVKYFQEKHPVSVTDSEVKKYYDDNKNTIPQLMTAPGGVTAKIVMFEDKAKAQDFLNKAKAPNANFDTVAKEANVAVKDLGEVNSQSFEVDGTVRKKLLDMKKFPSVELVDINDKSFAVVRASGKKDAQYVPFEQVKPGIENLLKQQKGAEVLTKEIDKLKNEYKVNVNKEYFERERKTQEDQAQKMAEAMNKEQGKKKVENTTENAAAVPMKAA